MVSDRHTVAFYQRDEQFAALAIDWLADGLRAGHAGLVIATPAHRALLEKGLSQRRLLGDGVISAQPSYQTHDAATTLAQFTADGWPDAALFDEFVGSMIRAAARGGNRPVRAVGEMVTLLLAGPTPQAAFSSSYGTGFSTNIESFSCVFTHGPCFTPGSWMRI